MKQNTIVMAMLGLLVLPLSGFATANKANFPADLMYQGKPIDALCFYNMAEKNPTVSLKACGIAAVSGQSIAGQNKKLTKEGYTGFNYTIKTPGSSYVAQGYSYYKPYGQINGYDIVYTVNNSGGNGEFSNLILVKRTGDTLQFKTVSAGDRCNGGVANIKNNGKTFSYSVNITPFDFLTLANNNPHQLKAYDDLQACAACCIASAVYSVKASDISQPALSNIILNENASEAGSSPNMTYQVCFNKLLKSYMTSGKTTMNMQQLNQFIQTFNAQCVHH